MTQTVVTVGRDPVLILSGPATGVKVQNQGIPAIKIFKSASPPATYLDGLAAAGEILNGMYITARNQENRRLLDDLGNGVNYYAMTADIHSKSASSNVLVSST